MEFGKPRRELFHFSQPWRQNNALRQAGWQPRPATTTDPGAAAFDSRSDPAAAEFRPEDDYESAVHLQVPSWRKEDKH